MENFSLIESSEAELVYLVVCPPPLQKTSMRVCIDFRLLNAVTKPFDYPMKNATEISNEIANANITCLGVLKGY